MNYLNKTIFYVLLFCSIFWANVTVHAQQTGPKLTINSNTSIFEVEAGNELSFTLLIGNFGTEILDKPIQVSIRTQTNSDFGFIDLDYFEITESLNINELRTVTRTIVLPNNFPTGTFSFQLSAVFNTDDGFTQGDSALKTLIVTAGSGNNTALPDLQLDNVEIMSVPDNSDLFRFSLEYSNIGNGILAATRGEVFLSIDNNLDSDDQKVGTFFLGSLNANADAKVIQRSISFLEEDISGSYYIFFKGNSISVSNNNDIPIPNEVSTSNNTVSVLFDFGGSVDPPQSCDNNLLSNGGFESNLENWSIENGLVSPTNVAASGMTAAELILNQNNSNTFFIQQLPVPDPNSEYELTFAARSGMNGSTSLDARIFFRDADGMGVNNERINFAPSTTAFETRTIRALPNPTDAFIQATFGINNFGSNNSSSVIIDDVCLRPVGEGLSRIDCDADNILFGRTILDVEWIKEGNVNTFGFFDYQPARTAALRGFGSSRIYQDAPAVVGADYNLEVFARRSGTDAQGRIQLQFIGVDGQVISQNIVDVTTDYWKNYQVAGIAPVGATTVRVRGVLDSGTLNNSFVEVTHFCLTSMTDPGPNRLPDLVLRDITYNDDDDVVQPGQNLIINYIVQSIDNISPPSKARITLEGLNFNPFPTTIIGETEFANIPENSSIGLGLQYQIPTDLPVGDYFIRVQVDPDNEIEEFSESNNQSILNFSVNYPDLELVEIGCPTTFPNRVTNAPLTYPLTFKNNGTTATFPTTVYLYQVENGRSPSIFFKYGEMTVPALSPGEMTTFDFVGNYSDLFPGYRSSNGETGKGNYFFSFTPVIIHSARFVLGETDFFCNKTTTDVSLGVTSESLNFGEDQLVRYTVSITNNGNESAYNLETIIGSTELPGGLVQGSPVLSKGILIDAGASFPKPALWNVQELAAGETATAIVTFKLFLQNNSGDVDTETLTFSTSSRFLIDTNEENNTDDITFTRGETTEICILNVELTALPERALNPGEVFSVTGEFTNQTNDVIPASTFGLYENISENRVIVARNLITDLVDLPAFAPNESRTLTLEFTLTNSFIFQNNGSNFSQLFNFIANANANGQSEETKWWTICRVPYNIRLDFPDVDVSIETANGLGCYGTDNIAQFDLKVTNNLSETTPIPIRVFLGAPENVDVTLPNISVETNESDGRDYVYWIIPSLAGGESAILERPYRVVNNQRSFIARIDMFRTGYENININFGSVSVFVEFDENCTNTMCSGDITLSSQAEVNAFGNCTSYDGDITISGTDITDLTPLNNLQNINGSLFIINNPTLPNLTGLFGLRSLDAFVLDNNVLLTSAEEPRNLTTLNDIVINNNPSLRTGLHIRSGLVELNSIVIIENPSLINLNGLTTITTVREDFTITNNGITTLGLESLETVGGFLSIVDNDNLTRLQSLERLESVGSLSIIQNDNLNACCEIFALLNSSNITGTTEIANNGERCSSPQQLLVDCDINNMRDVDLELSLITENSSVGIYESAIFTYTITNNGGQTADNIEVQITAANTVLTNGEQPVVSQGNFDFFGTQLWQVGSLANGESATLTVNYFFLAEPFLYAEVSNTDGEDIDSTPNNGNGQTAEEDDEAVFPQGDVQPRLPDLALANLNIPTDNIIQAGDVVGYILDVQNLGEITASGEYTIAAFLSTDNQLDSNDPEVGIIPTGNTPVGTINNVPGAITVPAETAAGSYFLIVVTDRDDEIVESIESNNSISIGLQIGCFCAEIYAPVCGSDGITYSNACEAECAGIFDYTNGECRPTGDDDIDLELSLDATNPNVLIYQNTAFQLTIANKGDSDAENVQVSLPIIAGQVVLTGGATPMVSQGSYNTFTDQIWNVGTLGAGQTATLEIDLFFLAKPFLFAEVIAATGNDIDSTPNNGNGQMANEDDEAIFGGTINGNNCRIVLSIFDKRCNDNGTPDNPEDDTFSFTLRATASNGSSTFGILSPINTFAPVPYGEDLDISDFPIKDGAVEVIVVDSDNANCRTELLVQPPATCSNGGGGSSDLVLTIDAPATYNQYTTIPVTYTITNNGTASADNITVLTPLPDGTTNSSSIVSQGSFSLFNQQWIVGSLAAGQSATFTWNIFALTSDGISGFGRIDGTANKIPLNISHSNINTPLVPPVEQTVIHDIQLYPTVTMDRAAITFVAAAERNVEISVYTLQGQQVLADKLLTHKGLNQYDLDVAALGRGTYFVKVGQFETLRLVKM